ncbi:MAG: hypothetical protein NTX44_00485 [Ignavibacteriales bacterium]|nr:hypothetical protein [Ignavibacteriales bacterium]
MSVHAGDVILPIVIFLDTSLAQEYGMMAMQIRIRNLLSAALLSMAWMDFHSVATIETGEIFT